MFKTLKASLLFLILICLGSVSFAGDKNFKIDKESFYVKVKKLVITPIENTVWQDMNYLYESKDMIFKWYNPF